MLERDKHAAQIHAQMHKAQTVLLSYLDHQTLILNEASTPNNAFGQSHTSKDEEDDEDEETKVRYLFTKRQPSGR